MSETLVVIIAFCLSLLKTFTVVVLAWATLRFFDKRMGFVFSEWWSKADDKAKSHYLAARCFAVFLAFALCMA